MFSNKNNTQDALAMPLNKSRKNIYLLHNHKNYIATFMLKSQDKARKLVWWTSHVTDVDKRLLFYVLNTFET